MQKRFHDVLTCGLVMIASGCGDATTSSSTTGSSQPAAPLYSITHAYDIANNNDASDMRVEVQFATNADNSQLTAVRLVIAKESTPFTEAQMSGLSDTNSFSIPISKESTQIIHPIGAKDADGDAITNDQPYNLYIAAVGNSGFQELSTATKLTLADKPIFAGSYVGTWEDLGPPGPGKYPMSMRIDAGYAVKMYYTGTYKPYGKGTEDATAMFVVDQATCSLAVNQLIGKYIGGGQFTTGADGGCPASKTISCAVVDEVRLVFDVFNWADCDGTRDVRLSYTRQ